MSVASAVRHCRSSTCHNRHACAEVSFSPGSSVNSARMRSISVCREDMTPPAVARSQVVESEARILPQLVGRAQALVDYRHAPPVAALILHLLLWSPVPHPSHLPPRFPYLFFLTRRG